MANKPENSQKTLYIEYCRSCDTHSWCTHHDEAKYHHTFLKLSELIAQRFPDIEVIGNMVPPHLIPFKISQNKYIDSQTNKYVVYPQIGSFQVRFNNVTVYSKKDNNTWPNLPSIVSKIGSILDPNYKSPHKNEKQSNSPDKETQITVQKQVDNSRFPKSEDEKVKVYKDQSKGFTLTDHFKLYRPKAKYQEKDWLTQKHQSQGSLKHFSQQFRGQSRQKSQKSQDSKRRRDFNGQTKLKEMLKSRGLMLKQQGKKEMIIKLDSIEEQNANYEEGNGATQRTQEIPNKKNKMQELEDEFSSLQNRFNNFETKVHDIHNKNKQFQQRQQPCNQYSRFKNLQLKNDQASRKQSKRQQVSQKENFYFFERASKLNQYLNASEEEKNQKLHKIYGQWKYLKQNANKNKKLLKNKNKYSQEPLSSDQQSQNHSNSPSQTGNVITFQPKKDRSTPKLATNKFSKEKGHKYSTLQKYENNKIVLIQQKFRTGEQFYNKNMKNHQYLNTESEQEVQNSSKLLKKGLGTMSMQALRKYASKEPFINHQRPQREKDINQFSQSAQNNIRQIQTRINNIQNKLKVQRESQEDHFFGKSTLQAIKDIYSNNKSRSQSQNSNYSTKNQKKRQVQSKTKNHLNFYRNSHKNQNNKNFRNVKNNKAQNKGKSRITQAFQNNYNKQSAGRSEAIQQQSQLFDSNNLSYTDAKQEHGNISKQQNNKKYMSKNHRQLSKQKLNNLRNSAFTKNQQKIYKSQSNKQFNVTHPKKIKKSNHSNQQGQRVSKEETDVTQINERQFEKTQKDSRVHEYPLHQQITYLRKKKQWRESRPVKKTSKEKQLRSSQEQQDKLLQESQGRNKLSQSKQTVFKAKNKIRQSQRQNSDTPKKSKIKQTDLIQINQQSQKSHYGRIRKNKLQQQDALRQSQDPMLQEQAEQSREESQQLNQNERQLSQKHRFERQFQQNESEQDFNRQEGSNPSVFQSSQTLKNQKQEEQSKPVQRVISKSQKSQIKKVNRKQNLSYYKSGQVCYEGESKRKNSLHQQTSGKSLQNGVSGWNMNAQQDGESDQIVMNQDQNSENNEQIVEFDQVENAKMRNSLDLELENDAKLQAVQKQIGKNQIHSEENEILIEKSQKNSKQQKSQKQGANQSAKVLENICQQNLKNQNQKSSTKGQAAQIKQELELQKLIARQYTNYVTLKLTELIGKQQSNRIQTKEAREYLSCEIAINLIKCPSVQSIEPHKQTIAISTSFMDYQEYKQVQQEEQGRNKNQNAQIGQQKVFMEQSQNESKEVQIYIHEVNQTVITQICSPNNQIENQTAQINGLYKKQAKQSVVTQALLNYKEFNTQQKSNWPAQIHKNSPLPINLSTIQQQNNVYSQAKQVSKFRQIGIQKQLTLEVSVQTDHPPQDLTADILMIRANSAKSNQVFNPPTSRQSHKRKVEIIESISQQPNPVKNNYFSQSKRESLFQKKKPLKQIQRAHIIDKIYSSTVGAQTQKFSNLLAGAEQDLIKQQGPVIKLVDFYLQGELFSTKGIELQLIETKFTRLLKVVQILCEKTQWLITRLFQDKNGVVKDKAFGVWLCKQYDWQCILVDDAIVVNQQNHPLYSVHRGNQLWFNILQKAAAIVFGGYQNLLKAQTCQLFTMLTGCNVIVSKIKEDPSKNNKLLSLMNQCLRKNYVIHAEKSDKSKKEQNKENIYYINSIRKAGTDEQALIELSQNGRESFWIKLSKFVTEFCKIEILQLRINHNFTNLDLGVGRPGQLTVVQLEFQQDSQGCVTLCYLGQSGSLRAFLYKQQKNKVLKLIGQAKQKNKSHLFFECSFTEGKYFVFAQAQQRPARLAYLGESHPRLTITQQIHSQGLKNQMAEYLPVRQNEQTRTKRSEIDSQIQWRGKIPRLQDNFVQSRLRQTFIDYVVGRNKR